MKKTVKTIIAGIVLLLSATGVCQEKDYIILRGDILDVIVMQHPEFTITSVVLPDGTFQYPGFGSIKVAGMTTQQLKDTLETALHKYVVNPIVTVFVRKMQGQSLNIFGYVNSPGQYQVYDSQELFFAIGLAGGIKDMKKVKKIRIIRSNLEIEEFNVRKYLKNNKKVQMPIVGAGDTIYVVEPRRDINWAMISAITTLTYSVLLIISYVT